MGFDVETVSRVALGLIIVGVAAIGLPHRRRADREGGRVSRRGDPRWFWPLMILGGGPVPVMVAAFLVAPRWVDFAAGPLPAWGRGLGAVLGLLGLLLFRAMFRHLGLNVTSTAMPRENATLVTSGPYRWVRHPMYLAALILALATALLTANAVVAVGGTWAVGLLLARSRLEERRLVEKFGDAYREYQDRTGAILPRWSRRGRRAE